MIVFPKLGYYGRLGNQLFQLAATISLAEHTNSKAKVPKDLFERETDGQKCLLDAFKINLESYDEQELNNLTQIYHQPGDNYLKYYEEFWELKSNTQLIGHFESELYFSPYKAKVLEHIQLKDEIDKIGADYVQNLKASFPEGTEIVSVHLRLGDYRFVRENLMWYFFYIGRVKEHFFPEKKYKFLFFTGGNPQKGNDNTTDIELCKNYLPNAEEYIFCNLNNTIQEFSVMKNCDHNILSTRSTLGWWSAYLNTNPNKKVICPRKIAGNDFNPDIYWPKEFIQVNLFQ